MFKNVSSRWILFIAFYCGAPAFTCYAEAPSMTQAEREVVDSFLAEVAPLSIDFVESDFASGDAPSNSAQINPRDPDLKTKYWLIDGDIKRCLEKYDRMRNFVALIWMLKESFATLADADGLFGIRYLQSLNIIPWYDPNSWEYLSLLTLDNASGVGRPNDGRVGITDLIAFLRQTEPVVVDQGILCQRMQQQRQDGATFFSN